MELKVCIAALAASLSLAGNPFEGRWAMQATDGRVFWLELRGEKSLSGEFFGATGGRLAKLIDPRIEAEQLMFHVERIFENGRTVRADVKARRNGEDLLGTTHIDGKEWKWTGKRAPVISDRDDGSWREGEPIRLLRDGLPKLRTAKPGHESDWKLQGGVLQNRTPKAELLLTRKDFWNFALHVEYKLPKNGNSGIGLRNHYELQLADDYGAAPDVHGNASVYSRLAPRVNASKPPGEWQILDLRLVGRELTVVLNGTRVMDRQTIEGLCGLALNPNEDQPGPVALQGDHGPVEFRNVVLTPLRPR